MTHHSFGKIAPTWAWALRSGATGPCGACHRARIRTSRWHRRESATSRPGREKCALATVICPSGSFVSSPLCKNISIPTPPKSPLELLASHPTTRGVSRSSRTRGADAVDAAAFCAQRDCRAGDEPVSDQRHADERCCCVRRSRVVLTPRRWRQVCGRQVSPTGRGQATYSASDGGKRARSPGRARRKPLKPLRAGMPGDSGVLVVTRVLSTTTSAHEAAGAAGIRHSPRPPWARRILAQLGRIAPRDREVVSAIGATSLRAKRSNPFIIVALWIARKKQ
jgi:hypothetical protein